MLECLQGKGHIYGLDVDAVEQEKTRKRLEALGYGPELLTVRKLNFANIDQVAAEVGTFDFVLADLGVSSMQIDNPDRGFSYKNEGPLDLRLDSEKGISAAERLKDISREELEMCIRDSHYINRDFFQFRHDYLFDEVITDMPFQMGHVTEEEIYGLYLRFFGCIAGFLKEDGIIILYSRNRGFVRPLAARNGFSVLKE